MKRLARFAAIAVVALAVGSTVSCQFFGELFGAVFMSVSGKAVNVMATVSETSDTYWKGQAATGEITLENASIKLTSLKAGDTTTYSATVSGSGTWVVTGVSPGKYKVEGTKDGWTFIPMEIELSGFMNDVSSELLAYPVQDPSTVLLIVKWNNSKIDVDSHLIIDTDDDMASSTARVTPITSTEFQYPVAPATARIKLDRDIKFIKTTDTTVTGSSLVETIRIISNPFGTGGSGWLRYYIDSWSYYDGSQVIDNGYTTNGTITKGGVLTGNPDATSFKERAGATVYIMQGNVLYGTWPLPVDTAENNIGITRIQFAPNASDSSKTDYTFFSFGNYGSKSLSTTIVPVGVKDIK